MVQRLNENVVWQLTCFVCVRASVRACVRKRARKILYHCGYTIQSSVFSFLLKILLSEFKTCLLIQGHLYMITSMRYSQQRMGVL